MLWEMRTSSGNRAEPVVVVGAGPVGMAAALALRAQGLPVLIVEAEPAGRSRSGSRAIFVHKESLQLLEGFLPGLGRRIAAAGLVWPTRRSTFRGRDVYKHTYPPLPPGALPPSTSLPQVVTERFLLEACQAAGIELRWSAPVTDVKVSDHDVVVALESGEQLHAPYAVGADGARSAVRPALGIPLDGPRSEIPFVIVDVAEDPGDPMPLERVFNYEHPGVEGRNVLLVPFAGGWRVDLQCREDDDTEDFSSPEGVRRWLARVLPPRYADRVRWVSTYRFVQAVARELTDPERRVLLVGEAAHLFAPFGARGMNSGIADAAAAAAAIRAALDAASPAAARQAIEHFATDRRDAALYNRDAARTALTHMQGRGAVAKLKRRVASLLAPRFERAGQWLDTAPYGPRTGRRGGQGRY
jgi:3-(3-hydroxy-phenyl)propionate hydroxylase